MTSTQIKDKIVSILNEKKGTDTVEIEIGARSSIADYFVIATGNTKTQVNSLADLIEEKLEAEGLRATHTDGREGGSWLVLDYDSVIVHIFERETRERYRLEKLWGDIAISYALSSDTPES